MSEKPNVVAPQEPSVLQKDDQPSLVMVQYGKLKDMDRSFDVAFWQAQDATARLNAAWELVEFYHKLKGETDELRLQRSVGTLQRQPPSN